MPELPEVETIRRDLVKSILHKAVTHLTIKDKTPIKQPVDFFVTALKNNSFVGIKRVGKLLMFKLARDNAWLLIHLKMTGQLVYRLGNSLVFGGHSLKQTSPIVSPKYNWITLTFHDGSQLVFNDMRKFGYLKVVSAAEQKEIIRNRFGIDALSPHFTIDHLHKSLRKRTTSLKAVLLNQKLVAGIGNIYADEICFNAKIKPNRRAYTLTPAEIKKLFASIKKILAKAVKYRGTTFSSFVDGHGHGGNFLQHLKVYGRHDQACRHCKTSQIQKKKLVGRGTHWCGMCQK